MSNGWPVDLTQWQNSRMNDISDTWQTLVRASVDRKHPWRVVGFCTQAADGPDARNVILRKVFPSSRQLVFFTDVRSQKMQQLAGCSRIMLLFWNPQHNLQLRLSGVASSETDETLVDAYWETVPEYARHDYGSVEAPGAVLSDSQAGNWHLATARNQFTVLNVHADAMDVLRLGRDGHDRKRFEWNDRQTQWTMATLMP